MTSELKTYIESYRLLFAVTYINCQICGVYMSCVTSPNTDNSGRAAEYQFDAAHTLVRAMIDIRLCLDYCNSILANAPPACSTVLQSMCLLQLEHSALHQSVIKICIHIAFTYTHTRTRTHIRIITNLTFNI